MTPLEINEKIIIPFEDKASSVKTSEAAFIYNFLIEKGITETLEVGFAYAKSASHILAATQSNHIVIDPFQEHYQKLGLKNVEKLGFSDRLTYYNDYSHNVLPGLVREKRHFGFIFIDGDHKFDGEFVDFYYADLLLNKGGYILLHDTWMRSTELVTSFVRKNRKDYRYIKTPLRNFALFQKVGDDTRNGMHFREFYSSKAFFSHNIIMWLTTGKSNFLKKFIFFLKEKLK
jgi:hypothetical protein